jgi:ABC-type sugar transport system substrate-binding protein
VDRGFDTESLVGDLRSQAQISRGRACAFACAGVILAGAVVFSGCDSASFVPPRPAGLVGSGAGAPTATTEPAAGAVSGATTTGARPIELIVGHREAAESEELKGKARAQAGTDKVLIRTSVAGEKDTPGRQADLVREATARHPLALVVEVTDPADRELGLAIGEARAGGLPVVLVGRPLAGTNPSGTSSSRSGEPILVAPEAFEASARILVAAAINNAKNAKFTIDGGAVLVINTASDPLAESRTMALRNALREAGVKNIQEIRFAGDLDEAKKKVIELLRADRKPGMVLSPDQIGFTASYNCTSVLGDERPYVVAGYSNDESGSTMARSGEFAAVAIFSPERLIRKAITTAVHATEGQRVPERVDLRIPVHVSPEKAGAPQMQSMRAKARQAASGRE